MIVLIGEGGAGKDSIINELIKKGYKQPINYTTRKKRKEDEDNLVFVSKEEFEELWKQGKMAQKAIFNEEFYGVSVDSLKEDVVMISITKSIKDLKSKIEELHLEDKINFKSFYIYVSEKERIRRMIQRGDSNEMIEKRLEQDKNKFNDAREVTDYTVENIDLQKTIEEILKIVK